MIGFIVVCCDIFYPQDLFQTPDTKKSIETLVLSLRQVTIDGYRRDKQAFKQMTAGAATTPVNKTPKTSGIGAALGAAKAAAAQEQNNKVRNARGGCSVCRCRSMGVCGGMWSGDPSVVIAVWCVYTCGVI